MINESKIESLYYTVQDVSQMVGVSRSKAYELVKAMNDELKSQNYIVAPGKIPKTFFAEKYYGLAK